MKRKKSNILSNEVTIFAIAFLTIVFFFLGDRVGALSFLRKGISYIAHPIYYAANVAGSDISSYAYAIVELDDFKKEYEEISLKLYEKEVENSYYALLLEENEALRKQIDFADSSDKYVLSKVLNDISIDSLRIDKGRKAGISVGDIVSIGNVYIGTIWECDENGSLVRLANSKSNSLEVVIVDGDWTSVIKGRKLGILSKAVVTGSAEGIKVENISNSADVVNGSLVVVNDSKVGRNLVLGYIVDLSSNPAEVSRNAYVSPIIEYENLLTVFVNINN